MFDGIRTTYSNQSGLGLNTVERDKVPLLSLIDQLQGVEGSQDTQPSYLGAARVAAGSQSGMWTLFQGVFGGGDKGKNKRKPDQLVKKAQERSKQLISKLQKLANIDPTTNPDNLDLTLGGALPKCAHLSDVVISYGFLKNELIRAR
jgi:hypothetical protein